MRIRATAALTATAAALSAALTLTALAVPAAGAEQADSATTFRDIEVNQSRDYTVVVGAARKTAFLVSAIVSDPSGVQSVSYELWHGKSRAEADGRMAQVGFDRCVKINEAESKCEAVVVADPYDNLRSNALAGVWVVSAVAVDGAGNVTRKDDEPWPARIKRQTHLSQADATPEPVKKGKDLTVRARMIVASWEQHKDVPLIGHQVLLQYRKGTSGAFTTLKKVKTDRNGWATATVKATADGEYRFDFAGTSLTQARAGRADFVDVK
ncbi:calcium-binding protein [Streptomyces sp. NPDC006356]